MCSIENTFEIEKTKKKKRFKFILYFSENVMESLRVVSLFVAQKRERERERESNSLQYRNATDLYFVKINAYTACIYIIHFDFYDNLTAFNIQNLYINIEIAVRFSRRHSIVMKKTHKTYARLFFARRRTCKTFH